MTTGKKRPELLAPAGDMQKLRAALAFGADAVYVGGTQFGLRAASRNFTLPELAQAADLMHAAGKKLYLTVNATPHNAELPALREFLPQAQRCGVDAVIVADLGVLELVKTCAPGLAVHISTQAGVTNYETARALFALGARRIVLARELTLEEIQEIRQRLDPACEIEVFVHGAVCISLSGRCLLSQYMTGRDSNRGACAQPCRWNYRLVEEKRPGQYYPVEQTEGGTYILNARDLCLLEHLDKLMRAGVDSFKLEGRVKTEYYVATITRAYRHAIDDCLHASGAWAVDPALLQEVCKASHRQYDTGFLLGRPEDGQIFDQSGYLCDAQILAVVENAQDHGAVCRVKNPFSVGEQVEVLTPGDVLRVTVEEILDPQAGAVARAKHPDRVVEVRLSQPVPTPAYLRRAAAQSDNGRE